MTMQNICITVDRIVKTWKKHLINVWQLSNGFCLNYPIKVQELWEVVGVYLLNPSFPSPSIVNHAASINSYVILIGTLKQKPSECNAFSTQTPTLLQPGQMPSRTSVEWPIADICPKGNINCPSYRSQHKLRQSPLFLDILQEVQWCCL